MIKEDNDKSRISDSLCAGCYLNRVLYRFKIEYVVLEWARVYRRMYQ